MKDICSPWSDPKDPEILFPINSFEELLSSFGWKNAKDWLHLWLNRNCLSLAKTHWHKSTKRDWLWGLGLPLMTDIERYLQTNQNLLFGISGLPGCGKTTLGSWVEKASEELDWPVAVISLDDFYLSASQLDKEMAGNPWNVPRGLPGSHSISLMEKSIEDWKRSGNLLAPKFEKSLRNGLGDRCGWQQKTAKILVIEGWFLGCGSEYHSTKESIIENSKLTLEEQNYRKVVQAKLKQYQNIWACFDRMWHLKAIDFHSTSNWKVEQERKMKLDKGASLSKDKLNSFIRMIQSSIPKKSLEEINSNVLVRIDIQRRIKWIGESP